MRVILEITSGPAAGKKTVLGAHHVLQVGRTEWADVALPHDGQLSAVHFALEADVTGCYVKDLNSSNGTLVNGKPVAGRTRLRHRDEIRAGQTLFAVRIEGCDSSAAGVPATGLATGAAPSRAGAAPVVTVAAAAVAVDAAAPAPATLPAKPGRPRAGYTIEKCLSELTLCCGSTEEIRPVDLAVLLSQAAPLYVIVDLNKLDERPRAEAFEYLLDWLPEESRTKHSPVIVAPSSEIGAHALLGSAWGKDAAMGVFSTADKAVLLPGLRAAGGMFVRPSILAPQLAAGPAAFIGHLLANVHSLLMEGPGPAQWRLFGHTGVERTLSELGFTQKKNN